MTVAAARPYRAVVTGAAGFIGSHLCEALLAAGHDVLGVDALTPYYDPAQKRANLEGLVGRERFDFRCADLGAVDLEEMLEAGCVVFHLAGQPGVRACWGSGFDDYVRHNVTATQRLLEAAGAAGVARLVLASSSSVYGDAPMPMDEAGPLRPVSPYGVTKLAAEQLCDVYRSNLGLDVVSLRFFTVYGPRQRPDMAFHHFIEAIVAGHPIVIHGDGSQRRDFTHVDDVVAVLRRVATGPLPDTVVNVGGGGSATVAEAVALIERLVDRRAVVEHRPSPLGDARDTRASTARLARLGVRTTVALEDGLASQVRWQRGARPLRLRGRRPAVDRGRRVLLYSHDTFGLGHIRRNLAVAHALVRRDPDCQVVMVTGSRHAAQWRLPDRTTLVQLPPAVKVGPERYGAADGGDVGRLMEERASTILSTVRRLRPDTFLVDHAPLGMKGELRPSLVAAREVSPAVDIVLGLRDVLDDAATVRRQWEGSGVYDVLRDVYDRVIVYGCRELYDVTEEYRLPCDVTARTRFAGYVRKDRRIEAQSGSLWHEGPRTAPSWRVLVVGGGGGDAERLFTEFLEVWPSITGSLSARALLVTGPYLPEDARRTVEARAGSLRDVRVITFSPALLSLIGAADAVVSMGGYNTVTEVVAARRPLVICPRTEPRREQLIRAGILERAGLARTVRLDTAGPHRLAETVVACLTLAPPSFDSWDRIDLGGAERAAETMLAEPAVKHCGAA